MAHGATLRSARSAAAAPASVSIDVVDDLQQLGELASDWRRLHPGVLRPTEHFAWCHAAAHAFAADGVHVAALRQDGRLVAVAPLVSVRRGGVRHHALVGVTELNEPMDLAWSDRDALRILLDHLIKQGTPLFLPRLPADSPTRDLLHACHAVVLERPTGGAPYILLDQSWREPDTHLNSGRRSDLRRAWRKAEAMGQVQTQIIRPEPQQVPELMKIALDVEAHSWKGTARTALWCDRRLAPFYQSYAHAACAEGILRLCFLRIGDRPAAMQIAVETQDAFWLLKIGYDAAFAHCSPGQLLLRDTIRHAAQRKLKRFEFMGQNAPWIKVWTQQEHPCVSLRVYPMSLRGLAGLAAETVTTPLRRWSSR